MKESPSLCKDSTGLLERSLVELNSTQLICVQVNQSSLYTGLESP